MPQSAGTGVSTSTPKLMKPSVKSVCQMSLIALQRWRKCCVLDYVSNFRSEVSALADLFACVFNSLSGNRISYSGAHSLAVSSNNCQSLQTIRLASVNQ